MALPTLRVRLYNSMDLSATPYDISSYVLGFSFRRGRNNEQSRVEAGTATLRLRNADRRFEPGYTTGPYGNAMDVMRRISIEAIWAGVVYPLFNGFIRAIKLVWPLRNTSEVVIELVDWFAIAARTTISINLPSQTASQSIQQLLDAIGYTEHDADPSFTTLNSRLFSNTNIMSVLNTVNDSEMGFMWCAGNGAFTWRSRYYRYMLAQSAPVVFGGSGGLQYSATDPYWDDSFLVNWLDVSNGSTSVSYPEFGSINRYGVRARSITGLMIQNGDVGSLATLYLNRWKYPALRIKSIELAGHAIEQWPTTLRLDYNNYVLINHQPPGASSAINFYGFVEAVEHEIEPESMSWRIRLQLSPKSQSLADGNYWILGTSALDINTVLGF